MCWPVIGKCLPGGQKGYWNDVKMSDLKTCDLLPDDCHDMGHGAGEGYLARVGKDTNC